MRFKIDENLHPDVAVLLEQHGHDAVTVFDQGLRGHSDSEIAQVIRAENRALVTLDLDFADMRRYPPAHYAGMIVLWIAHPRRAFAALAVERILDFLKTEPLEGRLWIVDDWHVRIAEDG